MTIAEYTALTGFVAGTTLYSYQFIEFVYSALFSNLPF
jgi:hypothetical protein